MISLSIMQFICKEVCLVTNYKKNSRTKTVTQHMIDTGNKPSSIQAATIPTTSAIIPASGDCVACTIAGNVITASVTYGT